MRAGYTFQRLRRFDVARMKELLRVFGTAFDDPKSYGDAVPSNAYLRALLSKPGFFALVALDPKGRVVGGLAAYELQKFEQERREIYIYDLAVLSAHRRRGIATGLITMLKPIARRRGAWVIYVQADPPDRPAVKLYESLGTREEVYHFDIPVD